jgi:hypothetical protein
MWLFEFWLDAVLYVFTNVSEEPAASFFRLKISRARIWLGNVGKLEGWGGSTKMLAIDNQ